MTRIAVPIDELHSPDALLRRIEAADLKAGDQILLLRKGAPNAFDAIAALALVFLVLARAFHAKQRLKSSLDAIDALEFTVKLEEKLFGGHATPEQLEASIREEFGIEVSRTELDPFDDDWSSFSLSSLDKAYGPGEPDYSASVVQEPNPNYGRSKP